MPRALIIVDPQRDFCEGGALPVEGGNKTCIAIANQVRSHGRGGPSGLYQHIVATKDFHLPGDDNGGHFKEWPEHCIQGTEGSMFHPEIAEVGWSRFEAVFYKGEGRPDYSGFQGKAPTLYEPIYLLDFLRDRQVEYVDVVGLATDYCVLQTALDAVEFGFRVRIPLRLTAAVGGDEAKIAAIEKVAAAQGLPVEHLT